MNALRKRIVDQLTDPESARFKDEFLSLSDDESSTVKSLCGFVNAKNQMGGYVGFKAFYVNTEGLSAIASREIPTVQEYLWPVWCARPILP